MVVNPEATPENGSHYMDTLGEGPSLRSAVHIQVVTYISRIPVLDQVPDPALLILMYGSSSYSYWYTAT